MAIEYFDSRKRAVDYLNLRLAQGFTGVCQRLQGTGGLWIVTWRARP
jgi:hypothetical protein